MSVEPYTPLLGNDACVHVQAVWVLGIPIFKLWNVTEKESPVCVVSFTTSSARALVQQLTSALEKTDG